MDTTSQDPGARPTPATQTPSPAPGRFRSAILFPPIRAVLGFFWVGDAIGLESGAAGLLPESLKPFAPLTLAVGALLGYDTFVRIVERRPVVELWSAGSFREAGVGATIGVALFSAAIGLLFLLGSCSATVAQSPAGVGPALGAAVMAGVTEELLIRAVAFRILETWLGSWLALAASALLFGLVHLPNPQATALSSVAIALEAGVMLAAAYMVTRRVWLAAGIHVAWNFTQSGLFGVPTSGLEAAGFLEGRLHGSALLSGGAFGPEASLVVAVFLLAIRIFVMQRMQTQQQRENHQETERLKSLVVAYRSLAGSFSPATGEHRSQIEAALGREPIPMSLQLPAAGPSRALRTGRVEGGGGAAARGGGGGMGGAAGAGGLGAGMIAADAMDPPP